MTQENNKKTIERHCPSCGKDNHAEASLHYAPDEWPMKQCAGCSMIYLEKTWSLDVLYEEFAWEESVEVECKRRAEMRGLERKFSKRFRKVRNALLPRKNAAKLIMQHAQQGNVLDIGSGSGHHLMQLSPVYTPYCIEISTNAVKAGLCRITAHAHHAECRCAGHSEYEYPNPGRAIFPQKPRADCGGYGAFSGTGTEEFMSIF